MYLIKWRDIAAARQFEIIMGENVYLLGKVYYFIVL